MTTLSLGPAGSLHVSATAQTFMQRMVRFGGRGPKGVFRLVASPGGCSGISSSFSIEEGPAEGDVVFGLGKVTLAVPGTSLSTLASVMIDFADTPTQAGLIFIDPKPSSCSTTDTRKEGLVSLAPLT